MSKKHRPTLKYKYLDEPRQYFGIPGWGQDLKFSIELYCKSKEDVIQKRDELVKDVAAVFAKYGMTTESFNIQNDLI